MNRAAQILWQNHRRRPLRCDAGDVRQDWAEVQRSAGTWGGRGVGSVSRDQAAARANFARQVKAVVGEKSLELRPMLPTAVPESFSRFQITVNGGDSLVLPPLEGDVVDSLQVLKPAPAKAVSVHDLPLGQPQEF